jgi:hypothetical protein
MTTAAPTTSLADFAASFGSQSDELPAWMHPGSASPLPEAGLGLRTRLEDVLDTVVALQRAEWLQDGVFVGPSAMPDVYRDVLSCARTLKIAIPPAIVGGNALKTQAAYGTDSRAFLHLSHYFFQTAGHHERRFVAGRLCGHIAARQVTAATLYALLVDDSGLRKIARKSLGPLLEMVLAPISLGVRIALARWHRAADISADRAGMICAGRMEGAGTALLRISLGLNPTIAPEAYLEQLKTQRSHSSPGRWTELLSANPWMHKRIQALDLFSRSELWVELTGAHVEGPLLKREELDRQTSALLGVR